MNTLKDALVWSCGGGTQSAAIAALIIRGEIPKPDLSFIVDTGREKSGTWEYLEGVIVPALEAIGVTLHRVSKEQYATVDLYAGNGDLLLPVFTDQEGRLSKMPPFCSDKWKQRVGRRWLREQGVQSCRLMLGMSLDETRRTKKSDVDWIVNVYPLVDLWVRRADCLRIVREMGWPPPPRSACWMCPNMSNREWREMRQDYPEDWENALAMERQIRARDPHVYLHLSGVPLEEADLSVEASGDPGGCESGLCFV